MMKRLVFLLILLPTLYFVHTSFQQGEPKPLKTGKVAPLRDVKMKNIDGTMLSLDDLKQTNGLVVVFSCNTCPFVVGNDKFPGWEVQYNALKADAAQKEIGFVLINSNEAKRGKEDSFEEMVKHAAAKSYSMPYLVDENSRLANAFGAKTTPHVYAFNKDMKLVYSGAIDNTWDTKRTADVAHLTPVLASLAKQEKVKEKSTTPRGCSIKRI